jgi:hypothetical protein
MWTLSPMKGFSWKTVCLYAALTLNIGLLFLHLEGYFDHAEIISVKDGFFFRSIPADDTDAIIQFPQLSLVRLTQGEEIYQVVPNNGYAVYSVHNIRTYKTAKSTLPIPIDFGKAIFYRMQKGDQITLKGKPIPYRRVKMNPALCPGQNRPGLIISTESLAINKSKDLKPGVYIRIGRGKARVLVGLKRDDRILHFEIMRRNQYMILSRVPIEYRCPLSAGKSILFNTDNARDHALFLDYSSTKGLLYRDKENYVFRTLGADPVRSPYGIAQKIFFLDDALIEINPNRAGQKLLIFIAINLVLILFLAFDKRIVSSVSMKIVVLLALFLYSMNFFLAFDIYHRFDFQDFFSERLNLIPLLVLIVLIFADSIRHTTSYVMISLGLIALQLAISKADPGMQREHAFYIVLMAILAWRPLVLFLRKYGLKLKHFERNEFGEFWVMALLLAFGVPFALLFREAIQIGGFRLELSSLMKLPFFFYYAMCFYFAFFRDIERGEFRTYVKYLALFTLPIFAVSLLSRDQGSFMLYAFFTVIMIIIFFPAPDTGDARSRRRLEIRLKATLAASILILCAGLLLAGRFLSNSRSSFWNDNMVTDLYARTIHPSSDLLAYETIQYQKNLVGQARWIGSTSFQVDRAMLSPYLVNDYIFIYLLPRLGYLVGAIIIAAYAGLFLFGWLALKSASVPSRFASANLFFVIGLSYFVFQSLYQLISQLGAKGVPFTGKEVYLLSAGRSQAIVFILFLALLNNAVSRESSKAST